MKDIEIEIQNRIHQDPEILSGKPVIRGTRIPVYAIIDSFGSGCSESEIVDDFPDLSIEDVRAALAFYLKEVAAYPISA